MALQAGVGGRAKRLLVASLSRADRFLSSGHITGSIERGGWVERASMKHAVTGNSSFLSPRPIS